MGAFVAKDAAPGYMPRDLASISGAGVDTGPVVAQRGALTLHTEPPEVAFRGQPIPLSPLEHALMAMLVIRGRAPWEAFEGELGISAETRDTLVHRIRRKFRRRGAPDPIETIRHWGLRLRLDAETRAGWGAGQGR